MCAAIWRPKILEQEPRLFQSSVVGSGLRRSWPWKVIGPQRTAKPLRVDAALGSSKAKLITLTQPENFRFQLAACGKAKKFSDRKIPVRLARHCRRQAERKNDLRLL